MVLVPRYVTFHLNYSNAGIYYEHIKLSNALKTIHSDFIVEVKELSNVIITQMPFKMLKSGKKFVYI